MRSQAAIRTAFVLGHLINSEDDLADNLDTSTRQLIDLIRTDYEAPYPASTFKPTSEEDLDEYLDTFATQVYTAASSNLLTSTNTIKTAYALGRLIDSEDTLGSSIDIATKALVEHIELNHEYPASSRIINLDTTEAVNMTLNSFAVQIYEAASKATSTALPRPRSKTRRCPECGERGGVHRHDCATGVPGLPYEEEDDASSFTGISSDDDGGVDDFIAGLGLGRGLKEPSSQMNRNWKRCWMTVMRHANTLFGKLQEWNERLKVPPEPPKAPKTPKAPKAPKTPKSVQQACAICTSNKHTASHCPVRTQPRPQRHGINRKPLPAADGVFRPSEHLGTATCARCYSTRHDYWECRSGDAKAKKKDRKGRRAIPHHTCSTCWGTDHETRECVSVRRL